MEKKVQHLQQSFNLVFFFLWLANGPTLFEPLGLFTLYFTTFTVCALLWGFQHLVMSLRRSYWGIKNYPLVKLEC